MNAETKDDNSDASFQVAFQMEILGDKNTKNNILTLLFSFETEGKTQNINKHWTRFGFKWIYLYVGEDYCENEKLGLTANFFS